MRPPNVAVQALVRARSEAEREARVACNRVLAGLLPNDPRGKWAYGSIPQTLRKPSPSFENETSKLLSAENSSCVIRPVCAGQA